VVHLKGLVVVQRLSGIISHTVALSVQLVLPGRYSFLVLKLTLLNLVNKPLSGLPLHAPVKLQFKTSKIVLGSSVVTGASDVVAGASDVVAGASDVVAGASDVVTGASDVVTGARVVVTGA